MLSKDPYRKTAKLPLASLLLEHERAKAFASSKWAARDWRMVEKHFARVVVAVSRGHDVAAAWCVSGAWCDAARKCCRANRSS